MKNVLIVFFALLVLASCRKKEEDPVAVEGVVLLQAAATVAVKGTLKLQPTVSPANATDKSLTWSTSAPDIATVDGEGVVTGQAVGDVVITATSKSNTGKSAQCAVKVVAAIIPLTSLSVSPAKANMLVGGTQQLAAVFNPADATDKNVTWTSSDEAKATVSATGLVTAKALGPVDITVKSTNNAAISAVCKITVTATAVAVTSIEVDPPTLKLQMSAAKQLTVKVKPDDATNANVTWASSDKNIATVDATGLVTSLAKGITTITAASVADPSKKASCEVTVTGVLVTEITITPPPHNTVRVGLELALTATVKPENAENKEVTWSSDKTDIATVDATTGKVTGVAKGSVVITATAKDEGKVTQTITLTVTPTVASITILPENPVVGTDAAATTTLRATVAPADAAQAVTWSSSEPTKATIDPSTGVVTGVALGTTTITATATDGSGITGTTTLTVKSSDASVTAISLGAENFNVNVPAPGAATTLDNAPHTIAANLTAVRVNITAAANASIKIGTASFISGGNANFTNPVAFTVTAQDGTTIKTYTVGIKAYNATSNPYGVYTAAHLNDVRNGKEKSYQLMNTITLPNTDAQGAATTTGIGDYATAGWLPIVHDIQGGLNSGDGFSGTFDGAGFRIENLYINRTTALGGLFGGGSGCTIKNLEVRGITTKTSVTINSSTTEVYAAILIGSMNGGTITNCGVAGDVSSNKGDVGGLAGISIGTVTNCFATGNINAGSGDAGGLIGFSSGEAISKSYAAGNVAGGYIVGGLIGLINSGNITDCFATGNVSDSGRGGCGGLVGQNNSSPIANSYATGNVAGSGSYLGALVGIFYGSPFTNCYRNNEAQITKYGVNFTPLDASSGGLTPKTKAQMQADDFKGNLNGTSGTIWGRDDNKNDKLPFIIGVGVGK